MKTKIKRSQDQVLMDHTKIGKVLDRATMDGQKLLLARYHSHKVCKCGKERGRWDCGMNEEELEPLYTSVTKILEKHFNIDGNKLELEKRAMLAELRK